MNDARSLVPSVFQSVVFRSVVKVPAWVEAPLGRYYMYYAHHHGQYIRLAYADRLQMKN